MSERTVNQQPGQMPGFLTTERAAGACSETTAAVSPNFAVHWTAWIRAGRDRAGHVCVAPYRLVLSFALSACIPQYVLLCLDKCSDGLGGVAATFGSWLECAWTFSMLARTAPAAKRQPHIVGCARACWRWSLVILSVRACMRWCMQAPEVVHAPHSKPGWICMHLCHQCEYS